MANNEISFKQIANNSCGVSVCRKIIHDVTGLFISEQKILDKVNEYFSCDNSLITFLKNGGSLPTEKIRELLKSFDIESKIEYDIPTSDMSIKFNKQNVGILTILETEKEIYHAVQVTRVSKYDVYYYDPGDDNNKQESILSFDEKRKPKAKPGKYLEILYLINQK